MNSFLYIFQTQPTDPLPWWQIITGILAIPAAIIGLVYTYRLSKKTRLESRKLELEIIEKESQSQKSKSTTTKKKNALGSSQIIAARIQDFVIRFIIFYLTLVGWGLIASLIKPLENALIAWLITAYQLDVSTNWLNIFWLSMINEIGTLGEWLIYILIGWPLLSDITKLFDLQIPGFLRRLFGEK